MNRDLTVGKPSQVLVRFSLPLLGSIVFQQLYNLADSFVAGKFLGDAALAAVGNAYEVTLIYLAFAFGCNVGCNVVLSLLFGAKEYGDLRTAVNTTFIASGVLCLILMALGFAFTPALLTAINTPPELMADTETYLYIYTGGLLFLFFYNIATGIFSAMGDSRTPFLFLMVSSLSNIGVDILFVTAGGMGVDGVAWATFLCQGISCLCAMAAVLLLACGILLLGTARARFSSSVSKEVELQARPLEPLRLASQDTGDTWQMVDGSCRRTFLLQYDGTQEKSDVTVGVTLLASLGIETPEALDITLAVEEPTDTPITEPENGSVEGVDTADTAEVPQDDTLDAAPETKLVTYRGVAEEIPEGSALWYSFGPGWCYRFCPVTSVQSTTGRGDTGAGRAGSDMDGQGR